MEIAVVILVAVGLSALVLATPTRNRILHYYDDAATTWNDANVHCRGVGMTLLTMDTEDVISAMERLSVSGYNLESLSDFWTGLHDYSDVSGVTDYVWGTCEPLGSYAPWKNNDSPETKRCIRGKKELNHNDNWETRECSKTDGKVVCEEFQGHCSFILEEDMTPDSSLQSITQLRKYNVSAFGCQTACRSRSVLPECWGYNFNADSHICSLYLGNTYTQLSNSLSSTAGNNTYLKFCFRATRHDDDLPAPVYVSAADNAPHTGCSGPLTVATVNEITTIADTEGTTSGQTTKLHISTEETTSTTDIRITAKQPTTTLAPTDGITTIADGSTPTVIETSSEKIEPSTMGGQTMTISDDPRETSAAETSPATRHDDDRHTNTQETTSTTGIRITANQPTTTLTPTDGITTSADGSTPTVIETSSEKIEPSTMGGQTMTISDDPRETSAVETSPGMVECVCNCRSQPDLTDVEKREFIDGIIFNLTIDTSRVSAERRKYISAPDPRPSAKIVGGAGVSLFSLVFLGIFILDFRALSRDIIVLWRRLKD